MDVGYAHSLFSKEKSFKRDGLNSLSKRGWTDNEMCLDWLKLCFNPETAKIQKGEYRMLLFDGHESYINRGVVEYCTKNKIILFCLPSHSTHLLQPLDIGTYLKRKFIIFYLKAFLDV